MKTLGWWVVGAMVLGGGTGCGGEPASQDTVEAQSVDIQEEGESAKRCNSLDPNRYYVSRDPDVCARIRFVCPNPSDLTPPAKPNYFGDRCGCGCER